MSSGCSAMWTLAGKIATSTASSHQRAGFSSPGVSSSRPPATSAAPLASTISRWAGMYGGMIAS